jgi:exonuclease VII large subunit
LTFKYEKLQERQKGLQHKLNRKMSNNIHNVQRILEAMARQSQKTDRLHNNNFLHKTDMEEAMNDKINMDTEINTSIANYKMNAYWYPSLLMYNSY